MEGRPFKIIHLDIAGQKPSFVPSGNDCGHYFVFWWNEIAVGDWYAPAGTSFETATFHNKIEERTKKGIDRYNSPDLKHYRDLTLTAKSQVDVSVIICTRNRSSDLQKCLNALQQQKCQPAEILVVDNAPNDESTYLVTQNFAGVRYIREPRAGLDIARNTGAKNARSPIVAYTDDDVEPHPMWIYHLNESFRNPEVMAMTGLVIAAELETESQQLFEKFWSFNRGYLDKYYDHQFFMDHLTSGPPVWEIGAGANMAFRRTIFEQAGYFDERLDVGAAGCNGDSEMWFRILAGKGVIHYNPRALAFHHHRREIRQLKRQLFNYMRGFAAAALIQQESDGRLNYKTHLYKNLPKFYLKSAIKGFPNYAARNQTIFNEMRGLVSGILYYYKHKQRNKERKNA